MAWNQPGNNGQDRDPWGSSKPGGNSEGNGNKGGRDQGPPDLETTGRPDNDNRCRCDGNDATAKLRARALR